MACTRASNSQRRNTLTAIVCRFARSRLCEKWGVRTTTKFGVGSATNHADFPTRYPLQPDGTVLWGDTRYDRVMTTPEHIARGRATTLEQGLTGVMPRDRYQFGPPRARQTDAERTEFPLSAQGSSHSRQRSYADQRRRDLEFQVGEHVLLKVSPSRGIKRFGLRNKLSPLFVGPFEILECVGLVAYRLALPPSLAQVHNVFHMSMLRKYFSDPSHVINPTTIQLREDLNYDEAPLRILACEVKQLHNRSIPYVKVQWNNHEEREATWELESSMRERYPQLFAGDA
uniref:Tf2-1-like SH3-like domain-containing protein n=1 Tax=Ananas comosus var. bracteatus TaxID=296719 RepID=A0A6V7P9K3_ANACO|nr:unnamed protein product [Ananas comosus var. bracteatus]